VLAHLFGSLVECKVGDERKPSIFMFNVLRLFIVGSHLHKVYAMCGSAKAVVIITVIIC